MPTVSWESYSPPTRVTVKGRRLDHTYGANMVYITTDRRAIVKDAASNRWLRELEGVSHQVSGESHTVTGTNPQTGESETWTYVAAVAPAKAGCAGCGKKRT